MIRVAGRKPSPVSSTENSSTRCMYRGERKNQLNMAALSSTASALADASPRDRNMPRGISGAGARDSTTRNSMKMASAPESSVNVIPAVHPLLLARLQPRIASISELAIVTAPSRSRR